MTTRSDRRTFLKKTLAGLGAAALPLPAWLSRADSGTIPRRALGRTGEQVSILGLGGWHLGSIKDDQEAFRLVREAVDQGVTFMDSAWEYLQGRSEERLGRALADGYRRRVFLMTKHHGRDRRTAMQHLEESLRRLRTEVIDLWQFHEVIYQDDPDRIFGPEGGIEAARQAKKEGKVRFIGFTGHKDPAIFERMLAHDFGWDAVQMPVNVLDAHFRSFQNTILPILNRRGIGAVAMKSLAGGHLLQAGVSPAEALTYTWSQPVATIVSGIGSLADLRANIGLARTFTPMSAPAQKKLLARTREAALSGRYEPFKTTGQFDGPVGRRQQREN